MGLTLHFCTASFCGAISTPDAKFFLKMKKPIEFSQRAKNSACLISEAGADVVIIFDYTSWRSLDKQRICTDRFTCQGIP
jgi:hypothetical protein